MAAPLTRVPQSTSSRLSWTSSSLRLRLGLPPLDIMPPSCALFDKDITNNPWHALGCQSLRRRSITVRHDRAMQLLVKYARSVGVLASLSPKDLSSLVPDGEFFLSRETVLVDLSGTHPLSPSLISSQNTFQSAIERRAASKTSKYRQHCAAEHGLSPSSLTPTVALELRPFGSLTLSRVRHHC